MSTPCGSALSLSAVALDQRSGGPSTANLNACQSGLNHLDVEVGKQVDGLERWLETVLVGRYQQTFVALDLHCEKLVGQWPRRAAWRAPAPRQPPPELGRCDGLYARRKRLITQSPALKGSLSRHPLHSTTTASKGSVLVHDSGGITGSGM
jgi:hypothetical protein